MNIIVGVSDMKVSNSPDDIIVTYALGSCIGVSIYDSKNKVGGILHFQLPESRIKDGLGEFNPCMFADTGIPHFFHCAYSKGAQKSNLDVKVAGGAVVLDNNNFFAIGKRNYLIMKKIFWKNQILISGEHIGGNFSRTMYLEIASGKTWIRINQNCIAL